MSKSVHVELLEVDVQNRIQWEVVLVEVDAEGDHNEQRFYCWAGGSTRKEAIAEVTMAVWNLLSNL